MANEKVNIFSVLIKILFTIIIITFFEYLTLFLVASIPQDYIAKHVDESADILLEKSVFFYLNENDTASRIDRYADSILLNIAYSYNSEKPMESVARSSYYHKDTQNENQNLKDAVEKKLSANTDYIRYWHGSNTIVKPLLLFTNINGIYIINASTIAILLFLLLILLRKRINLITSIWMFVSCIGISIWYVPFSLEYTWNIILMLIATTLSLFIHSKKLSTCLCFFVIVGNITAFFDFLSTETITFSIPITCILLLKAKEDELKNTKNYMTLIIKTGLAWLTGYISAWLMKWSIASVVLQTNAFQLALQQASMRINGETEHISLFTQTIGAVIRNASCLFPFSFIQNHSFVVILVITGSIAIFYYLFKKEKDSALPTALFLIAIIPYIRFLLISNHSYLHYFFTYRAQLASIFAIGLGFIHGIDYNLLKKEFNKICKKIKKS